MYKRKDLKILGYRETLHFKDWSNACCFRLKAKKQRSLSSFQKQWSLKKGEKHDFYQSLKTLLIGSLVMSHVTVCKVKKYLFSPPAECIILHEDP